MRDERRNHRLPGQGTVIVRLLGGLGNQLFQAAAADFVAGERRVLLLTGVGDNSSEVSRGSDLEGLTLPERFEYVAQGQAGLPPISKGMLDLGISVGVRSGTVPGASLARAVLQGFFSRRLSMASGTRVRFEMGSGTGYTNISHDTGEQLVLSGYFQSSKYAFHFRQLAVNGYLRPRFDPDWIQRFERLAVLERPLVVHVRLGDYVGHSLFGTVGKDYYRRAYKEISAKCDFRRIWIFSDEPSRAQSQLPDCINQQMPRLIAAPRERIHPTSTLFVLSLGAGYILTNSTFGYWGAMLNVKDSPPVFVPRPWFIGFHDETDLIPANWHQMDRVAAGD